VVKVKMREEQIVEALNLVVFEETEDGSLHLRRQVAINHYAARAGQFDE
jgi:hypothetical protein